MLNRSFPVVKNASPLSKFGRNLARVRSARKMTQEGLAERADIHARYLQKLEAGAGHPSLIVLCRLKRALNCEWNDLLGRVDP
jgi:transcriptional regulator with XRE-family HTH domain